MYVERLTQETMGLTEGVQLKDGFTLDSGQGLFFAMQVFVDTVITSLDEANVAVPEMAGVTLLAGSVYYGNITNVVITSGHAKLFKHVDTIDRSASTRLRK